MAEQVRTARTNLRNLKAHQETWQPLSESVLKGDLGRRVAASPTHLKLAANVMQEDRASVENVDEWEQRLYLLAEPVESAASNPISPIAVGDEHAQLLSELTQTISPAMESYSHAQSLMKTIAEETASLEPYTETFEEVVRKQKQADDIAQATRVEEARQLARKEAEQLQIESAKQSERALAEAERKREEAKSEAKKREIEALAKSEQEQADAEALVVKAQREAIINGLAAEAAALVEKLQWAKLEKEFEKDKATIEGHLSPFISDGYTHRPDGTNGPVSLSVISGAGALEPTAAGLLKLVLLANFSLDRPPGPFPLSSDFGSSSAKGPVETAQKLLTKYEKLMVEKKLLAP